jgi:hypothetical protein
MQPKTYLHIGRQKTGTSAIQEFLAANLEQLLSEGFHFPLNGRPRSGVPAHHLLAQYMNLRSRGQDGKISRNLALAFDAFRHELSSNDTLTAIVSSEALQGANPKVVAEFFQPGETRIVVYIREQVDYLLSSYSQAIHAKGFRISLPDFAQQFFLIDYEGFLNAWSQVFGQEQLCVRIYDREQLRDQDIVSDFMGVLGFPGLDEFNRTPAGVDVNPSIGGELLEFKRLLNNLDFEEDYLFDQSYALLSRLTSVDKNFSRKPYIDAEFQRQLRESYRKSNCRIFDRYFGTSEYLFRDLDFSRKHQESGKRERELHEGQLFLRILQEISVQNPLFCAEIINKLRASINGAPH